MTITDGRALSRMTPITDGEFAGWMTWPAVGPFEAFAGPYAMRKEPLGVRCAMRAGDRHMNGAGTMHGGCIMSFADFALASIAAPAIDDRAVTVTLTGNFLGAVHQGDLVEATGKLLRAGQLIFVTGLITARGLEVFSFTGIMRRF